MEDGVEEGGPSPPPPSGPDDRHPDRLSKPFNDAILRCWSTYQRATRSLEQRSVDNSMKTINNFSPIKINTFVIFSWHRIERSCCFIRHLIICYLFMYMVKKKVSSCCNVGKQRLIGWVTRVTRYYLFLLIYHTFKDYFRNSPLWRWSIHLTRLWASFRNSSAFTQNSVPVVFLWDWES